MQIIIRVLFNAIVPRNGNNIAVSNIDVMTLLHVCLNLDL
jgi:hypothetical protein